MGIHTKHQTEFGEAIPPGDRDHTLTTAQYLPRQAWEFFALYRLIKGRPLTGSSAHDADHPIFTSFRGPEAWSEYNVQHPVMPSRPVMPCCALTSSNLLP